MTRMLRRSSPGLALAVLLVLACVGAVTWLSGPSPVAAQGGPAPAPFAAKNMHIVGYHDLGQRAGLTSEVAYHKKTAYVGYRCGSTLGSSFVDVKDPTKPQVVFVTQPMSGTFADDVYALSVDTASFKGDLLVEPHDYCRRQANAATRFWDVTNPRSPVLLSTLPTGDGVHNAFPFTRGKNAYVILAAPNADGRDNTMVGYEATDLDADFAIVDVTDPRQPVIVSRWNAHQAYPSVPAVTFQHDTWANAAGTLAYGAYWDLGIVILDITDITNPKPISRTGYADVSEGNTHGVVLTKNEDYAVINDEDFDPYASRFDVLAPAAIAGQKSATVGEFMVKLIGQPPVEGSAVWVGRGCDVDPAYPDILVPDPYKHPATGKIAVIARGSCSFANKVRRAQAEGAIGAVIVNNVKGGGPALGGVPTSDTTIGAAGIGNVDGYAITTTVEAGTPVTVRFGISAGEWGYTRIFDFRDITKPVQVAEYTVPESRMFPAPADQSFGYSAHNSWIVGDKLYIAHYDAGIRMLDISDPTKPRETGYLIPAHRQEGTDRYRSSMWGVAVDENGLIYASDMINGLYILAEGNAPVQATNTPVQTSLPPVATLTPIPTGLPPVATATPPGAGNVCPQLMRVAPMAAINAAVANPRAVRGFMQRRDPGKPESSYNPLRTWLSIHAYSKPYHWLFNSLEYKVGCP
jgi:hypothetical protein